MTHPFLRKQQPYHQLLAHITSEVALAREYYKSKDYRGVLATMGDALITANLMGRQDLIEEVTKGITQATIALAEAGDI